MRTWILISVLLVPSLAHAFLNGTKHVSPALTYACLDLNGIPISNGTSLAGTCCSGGSLMSNPPAECGTGPNTISPSAMGGVANAIKLANDTLGVANNMNGVTTAQGTTPNSNATSVGSTAGGQMGGPGSGASASGSTGTGDLNGQMGSGQGGGADGSGGGAGGGSGGGSLGSSSGPGGGKTGDGTDGTKGAGADGASGMAYASNGGGGGGNGAANYASLFGGGGNGKGVGDLKEMKFGDGSDGAGGKNGFDPNSITGSPNDAADYLKRIDRDANLFIIVSKRYTKENIKKHVGE